MCAAPYLEPAAPPRPHRFPLLLREERRLFLVCLLALLATWASRLVLPAYSSDDYILLRGSADTRLLHLCVTQGRFGEAALHFALVQLGLDPVNAYGVVNLAALGLLALAAVWLTRSWGLAPSDPSTALVAALLFTHPFCAEVFTFRIAPGNFALAVATAVAALAMLRERGLRAAPLVLMALSLSLYQVSLNLVLVGLSIATLLAALRTDGTLRELRPVTRDALSALAGIALACLVYAIANAAVQHGFGIPPEDRFAFLGWSDVPSRAAEAREFFQWLLLHDSALSTPLLNALVLLLLAGSAAAFVGHAIRRRAPALALIGLAGLGAAILAVPGVVLLMKDWWPAARTLTAMGLVCSGALAICLCALPAGLRSASLVVGGLLLFGFAGLCGRVADEQQRVNTMDREITRKILERLEDDPRFAEVETIVFVNARDPYPLRRAIYRDLNKSALMARWALPYLVEEMLGRKMRMATTEEIAAASRYCASAAKWPRAGATTRIGKAGVACF